MKWDARSCDGKWSGILSALGVPKNFLVNRHGPCPMCGGKDRFRFDDKGRGMWFCSQCGSGDGIGLVQKINGMPFRDAVQAVNGVSGTSVRVEVKNGPSEASVRSDMNAIWKGSGPLSSVSAGSGWFTRRIGEVPTSRELRAHPRLELVRAYHPAIVARITDITGKPVNLHRTFLSKDGQKADINDPRRVMPADMPKGCAVRLSSYTDTLGIAEGIETALSATAMTGVPCWAAVNANNMENWTPPDGVSVVIFADNDHSFTGQAAAYSLARKLTAKKILVDVRMPERQGDDWNDVHAATRA